MRPTHLVALTTLALSAPALAGKLTLIPIPSGLEGHVFNTGISGDGTVVAGNAPAQAFYWTELTGVVYIEGSLAPGNQGAGGNQKVSEDGTRICVQHLDMNSKAIGSIYQPLEGSWTDQPDLGSNCDITRVSAWTISHNGQVLGGLGYGPSLCNVQPSRWLVGNPATTSLYKWFGWNARVNGCNSDGSIMCGWQAGATGQWQGCFWKFNGTSWAQTRIATAAGVAMGEAYDVSDDGTRVFGTGSFTSGITEPYMWTSANKAVSLGASPMAGYTQGFVAGCKRDGKQVCTFFRPGPVPLAVGEGYMWIDGQGYVTLESFAAAHGVTVPDGVHLAMPMDMSPDGLAVCGVARNDIDGYHYTFALDMHAASNPCPSDLDHNGVVDGADLGIMLGNWNGSGNGDINNDGRVDGADLGILLGAFGGCP